MTATADPATLARTLRVLAENHPEGDRAALRAAAELLDALPTFYALADLEVRRNRSAPWGIYLRGPWNVRVAGFAPNTDHTQSLLREACALAHALRP